MFEKTAEMHLIPLLYKDVLSGKKYLIGIIGIRIHGQTT
uniref:Uncharacterized protein n=1 Tax=Onchocerca volvulus TaxID=6282 RepID=A0A8R1XWL6_ONCVO